MADKTNNDDDDFNYGDKSPVKRDLIRLHKGIKTLLDSTTNLKITLIDPNAELIDSGRIQKIREESIEKQISKLYKEKKRNNKGPINEYLKKIRMKNKLDLNFLLHLDHISKDESQTVEDANQKNPENNDLTLDNILKGKIGTNNPHAEETDETQVIEGNYNKNQGHQKENLTRSAPNDEQAGPKAIHESLFSALILKYVPQRQEDKSLPQINDSRLDPSIIQNGSQLLTVGEKLPSVQENQSFNPSVQGSNKQILEPRKTQTEGQTNQAVSMLHNKLLIAGLRDSLKKGYFDRVSFHSNRIADHGFNPFDDSKIDVDLPGNGTEYTNPFKRKKNEPQRPKISVEYYEEEDDEPNKGNQLNPKNNNSDSPVPVFSNPFDFQNGIAKSNQVFPRAQNVENTQGLADQNMVVRGSKGEGLPRDSKKQKKRNEREVQSGYDPDDDSHIIQTNNRKNKESSNNPNSGGINKLKDWMGQRLRDDAPEEQDNQHQSNPKYKAGESVRLLDKPGSWLRMKGMDSTNSDLDTVHRSDKGFDWILPENMSPLLISRKHDQQNPVIIEENLEQTHGSNNQKLRNQYNQQEGLGSSNHFSDERGSTVLNVRNMLPDWYGEDPDTDLYENMYMVDAVRYNNFKLIHHPVPQSLDRNTMRSKNRPSVHNRDLRNESPPNLSHKIEPSRASQKSDKCIPKVICFVTKYNGGDLEDDEDEEEGFDPQVDRFLSPDKAMLKKSHDSPYFEVQHQNAFRPPSNPLKNSNYGTRVHIAADSSNDDGYFDVDKYKQNQQKWARNNVSDVGEEEDEGVRQTVRTSVRLSHKRF